MSAYRMQAHGASHSIALMRLVQSHMASVSPDNVTGTIESLCSAPDMAFSIEATLSTLSQSG